MDNLKISKGKQITLINSLNYKIYIQDSSVFDTFLFYHEFNRLIIIILVKIAFFNELVILGCILDIGNFRQMTVDHA